MLVESPLAGTSADAMDLIEMDGRHWLHTANGEEIAELIRRFLRRAG